MSDILLINSKLNHESYKTISPPLGIAYLCASLRKNRISFEVFDCNLSQNDIDNIVLSISQNGTQTFPNATFTNRENA